MNNERNTIERLSYSIDELAQATSISAQKIRKDIRSGMLASHLVGTRRIILAEDGKRYLRGEITGTGGGATDKGSVENSDNIDLGLGE